MRTLRKRRMPTLNPTDHTYVWTFNACVVEKRGKSVSEIDFTVSLWVLITLELFSLSATWIFSFSLPSLLSTSIAKYTRYTHVETIVHKHSYQNPFLSRIPSFWIFGFRPKKGSIPMWVTVCVCVCVRVKFSENFKWNRMPISHFKCNLCSEVETLKICIHITNIVNRNIFILSIQHNISASSSSNPLLVLLAYGIITLYICIWWFSFRYFSLYFFSYTISLWFRFNPSPGDLRIHTVMNLMVL